MSKKNQAKRATATVTVEATHTIPQATGLDVGTSGNKKVEPIVLSTTQKKMFDELKTTSSKIRYLAAESFKRGQIALFLNKKYQHVRNVLITPLKTELRITTNATNANTNTATA